MEKTLKIAFGTVVGVTGATLIVQDMYKLGAYAACHKWGKRNLKLKNV
ncbi:hypothetical protein JFV29_00585 [Peribacillus sp. TH16]|nr:hypothetical protein [Peribacillus sp. TH16]MBK5480455.1 hypothetical protein [Peribacillus sp. TH16]